MINRDLYQGMRFDRGGETGTFTTVEDRGNGFMLIEWVWDDPTFESDGSGVFRADADTAAGLVEIPVVIHEEEDLFA